MDLKSGNSVSNVFMHLKCGTAPQQGCEFSQTRSTPAVLYAFQEVLAFHRNNVGLTKQVFLRKCQKAFLRVVKV